MAKKKRKKKKSRVQRLREKLARALADEIEDEEDPEEGPKEEDLDEDDGVERRVARRSEDPPMTLGNLADNILPGLGALGQLGQQMITGQTPKDAEGNPGFNFQRPAGSVRKIRVDKDGNVRDIEFTPEEWPPRGEGF